MVCPKRERDFAAVMEVMFDSTPDDRLPRVAVRLVVLLLRKHVVQVGRCPANESRMNHLPGGLQPTYQLGGISRRCARYVPCFQWSQFSIPLAHDQVEIADSATDDMGNIFPDRAQMWSDSQGELFGREWRNSVHQEGLIDIPTFVERQKMCLLFGHRRFPFLWCNDSDSSESLSRKAVISGPQCALLRPPLTEFGNARMSASCFSMRWRIKRLPAAHQLCGLSLICYHQYSDDELFLLALFVYCRPNKACADTWRF